MSALDFVLRPAWLAWLALVPIVVILLVLLRRRDAQRRVAVLGKRQAEGVASGGVRARAFVAAAACAGALVAGAGPRVGSAAQEELVGLDVVVALDVSRSMRARDVGPDRLGRAQDEIAAFSADLGGHRAALVAFAGEARLLVPLTVDGAALARRARAADPTSVSVGGTDLADVLREAGRALGTRRQAEAAVLLLSDGEDLEVGAREAARELAEGGIRIHAFAVGSAEGARIPDPAGGFVRDREGRDVLSRANLAALAALAEITGGSARAVDASVPSGVLVRLREDDLDARARSIGRRSLDEDPGEAWRGPLVLACLGGLWLFASGRRRRR